MQTKHAWGQVLKNVNRNNVKSLISTTIRQGTTTLINQQGSTFVFEAIKNNVVVGYAVVGEILKISDAWIKTR